MNTITNDVEGNIAGSPAVQSTTVRSGTYAFHIASLVSGTAERVAFFYAAADSTVNYFGRCYLYIVTLPSAENRIMSWTSSAGAVHLAWITLDSGGLLRLFDEDGAIGSASAALSLNTWYRIEMQFNTAPAAGSHVITGRIDGVDFATSSARSISRGGDNLRIGGNVTNEAQTQGDWYFDDCAVNNASGGSQTSWPGAGSIVYMHPDAAGDNAMGTRGGADSGSDFGQVDEVTPNDATDYYILDVNADILDLNIGSSSSAGIKASDTVTLVEIVERVSALTAATCSHRGRIKSQASGTTFSGTTTQIAVTAWNTQDDANPRRGQCVSYTDPQAGGAWTPALLDTAQIGVEAVDAAPDVLVSTLIAIVEYIPVKSLPIFRRPRRIVARRR